MATSAERDVSRKARSREDAREVPVVPARLKNICASRKNG